MRETSRPHRTLRRPGRSTRYGGLIDAHAFASTDHQLQDSRDIEQVADAFVRMLNPQNAARCVSCIEGMDQFTHAACVEIEEKP